jgi:hypothetical protein
VRPLRVYHQTFTNGEHTVTIPSKGRTPCEAKNEAWVYLARLAKVDGLPDNGWSLVRQEDQGIVIG